MPEVDLAAIPCRLSMECHYPEQTKIPQKRKQKQLRGTRVHEAMEQTQASRRQELEAGRTEPRYGVILKAEQQTQMQMFINNYKPNVYNVMY